MRHLAPAEQRQALLRHLLGVDVQNDLPPFRIVRHEHVADRVVAGLRQMRCRVLRPCARRTCAASAPGCRRRRRRAGRRRPRRDVRDCRGSRVASSTILCDLRPLMSAMKPTPQESFSWRGSNRPLAAGTVGHNGNSTGESLTVRSAGEALAPTSNRCVPIVVSAVRPCRPPAHLPRARPKCRDANFKPSREGRHPLRVPLAGPSRDRSVWRHSKAIYRPQPRACRQLGQQCCPNMPKPCSGRKSGLPKSTAFLAVCCPSRRGHVTRGPRLLVQRNRIALLRVRRSHEETHVLRQRQHGRNGAGNPRRVGQGQHRLCARLRQ